MKIRTVKHFGEHTPGVPCAILDDGSRIVGGVCGAAPWLRDALRDCLNVIEFEASASGKLDDVKRSEGYKKARAALEKAGAA